MTSNQTHLDSNDSLLRHPSFVYVAGPDVVYGVAAAFYLLSIGMIARIRFIRTKQRKMISVAINLKEISFFSR